MLGGGAPKYPVSIYIGARVPALELGLGWRRQGIHIHWRWNCMWGGSAKVSIYISTCMGAVIWMWGGSAELLTSALELDVVWGL